LGRVGATEAKGGHAATFSKWSGVDLASGKRGLEGKLG